MGSAEIKGTTIQEKKDSPCKPYFKQTIDKLKGGFKFIIGI